MPLSQQLINDLQTQFDQGTYWRKNELTYYFRNQDNPITDFGAISNFTSWPEISRGYFREAMGYFSKIFNMTFTESANQSGDISIGAYQVSAAYVSGWLPSNTNNSGYIDFEINYEDVAAGSQTNFPGRFVYGAVVHEIGHALGLPHPANGQTVPHSTSMFYWEPYGHDQLSFGMHDIQVLQKQYGTVTDSTNDTYSLVSAEMGSQTKVFDGNTIYLTGPFCLWDGGGSNSLDLSLNTLPSYLDMRPGEHSDIGDIWALTPSHTYRNFSIAFNSIIDNATGSGVQDWIVGNDRANSISGGAGNDTLSGGAGNDTLDGGSGTDIVSYSGTLSSYTVTETSGGYTVADNSGLEGADTLSNVEKLQFSDKELALNSSGSGSSIAVEVHATTNCTLAEGELRLFLFGKAFTGTGNAADNVLVGSSRNNILDGKAGNDSIDGGDGRDILTGGDGADTFGFSSTAKASTDVIMDFTCGSDVIEMNINVFVDRGFVSVTNLGKATNGESVIYVAPTGRLYYDPDGAGSGAKAVQLAKLIGCPELSSADVTFA